MQIVYILLCSDGTYYTGCTQSLEERLQRHNNGNVEYTKTRLPVEVIFYCCFKEKSKAFQFEKHLKSGSGIAFRNKHFI